MSESPDPLVESSVYTPPPRRRRRGLALCLSGGGYRAALFHLGALTRLNELGLLARVDTVSSVSGGSILAAHLAVRLDPWPAGVVEDWEELVALPFRNWLARDSRTRPILKRWLLPWNWPRSGVTVEYLAREYDRFLGGRRLVDLPPRPRFVLCATDLVFGVNWIFERERVGDWQAGYREPPPEDWTLARAVAASSCFPPIFGPMHLRLDPEGLDGGAIGETHPLRGLVGKIRLSDGGLYDNLGLEPVWKTHRTVLVSDGGAPFRFVAGRAPLRLLRRYFAVAAQQSASIRKRWLISNFESEILDGTYWGLASSVSRYSPDAPGYSGGFVDEVVAHVRTDLDGFEAAEMAVLENHGYWLTDVAVRRHEPELIGEAVGLSPPHPDWVDEGRAREALRSSHRRLSWGRWRRAWTR